MGIISVFEKETGVIRVLKENWGKLIEYSLEMESIRALEEKNGDLLGCLKKKKGIIIVHGEMGNC